MTTPRTCRLVTLGCKVNQYETQYVKETLEANGYVEAADGQPADLCIVNTCTVTRRATPRAGSRAPAAPGATRTPTSSSWAAMPRAIPKRSPGCPASAEVITDKTRLAEELAPFGVATSPSRHLAVRRSSARLRQGAGRLPAQLQLLHHSARCGPSLRSRPPEEIVEEVHGCVADGYREIVLTGIHLGHYGIDLSRAGRKPSGRGCGTCWNALAALPGDFRMRLSSLEAAEARDDLIRALAEQPRICPHLHLCLQSGSDRILAA